MGAKYRDLEGEDIKPLEGGKQNVRNLRLRERKWHEGRESVGYERGKIRASRRKKPGEKGPPPHAGKARVRKRIH